MKLFALLLGRKGRAREPVLDDVLGTLEWDPELRAWKSSALLGRHFMITLPGNEKPEHECLKYAREIQLRAREFLDRVRSELEREAKNTPKIGKIILELKVESVDLSSHGNGMVYFEGEEDGPVWRMDLVEGAPGGLGCDT
jgi:hypothetical protein